MLPGPPPISAGRVQPGAPIEVERTINATGLLALAGRQHPAGFHLAGQRVTVRLDHRVMHLLGPDRTVLRSLPNPLTAAEVSRIRDGRPGGPAPVPAADVLRVDRRVSCRGSISIAGQKIRSGSATPDKRSPSNPPTPPSGSMTVTNCWSRSCAPPRNRSPGSKHVSPNRHTDFHRPARLRVTPDRSKQLTGRA